jgi:hypothetical protein
MLSMARKILWKRERSQNGKIYLFKSYCTPILTCRGETKIGTMADISRLMVTKANNKGKAKGRK